MDLSLSLSLSLSFCPPPTPPLFCCLRQSLSIPAKRRPIERSRALSWHHVIRAFPCSGLQWKSETTKNPYHHYRRSRLQSSKSTCSWLNLLLSPPFISEIRNGRSTLQPSQRLSQIRPLSPFHNTRERKEKKKNSTVLFYTFLLSLFPQ